MNLASNTLTIPNPMDFQSYGEFFKVFWKANQELSFFSSRYLAAKLDWSSSYFHDVLADRKKLTLQKAFEISQFLNLSIEETEYLVWLVIKEFDHKLSSDFARKKISK